MGYWSLIREYGGEEEVEEEVEVEEVEIYRTDREQ
jgi:hypothetical protein